MDLTEILGVARTMRCTDVHLIPGYPVIGRRNGRLFVLIDAHSSEEMIGKIRESAGRSGVRGISDRYGQRYRVTAYTMGKKPCAAIRVLAKDYSSLLSLGLPAALGELSEKERGLTVIASPPGNGRTTTMAAAIERLNQKENKHIIVLEECAEYLFASKKCLISQLEAGTDFAGWPDALDLAQTLDGDLLALEMPEGAGLAERILDLARCRLVLLGMCARDAADCARALRRRVPGGSKISDVLNGIFVSRLVPTEQMGLKPVCEVAYGAEKVLAWFQEGDDSFWEAAVQSDPRNVLMDQSLASMRRAGWISEETAVRFARREEDYRRFLYGRGEQERV